MESNQTNEIKFINLTGREIRVFSIDSCDTVVQGNYTSLVPKDGEEPLMVIPPSGTVAKITQIRRQVTVLDGIPVNQIFIGKVEGLPSPGEFNTFYIVSPSIATVETTRNDLLIVDSTVRDKNGNIIGCTSFGRFINPYV